MNIAEYWKNDFKSILTDIDRNIKSSFKILDFDVNMIVRVHEIERAIQKLNCDKSSGPDLVSSEHLKHSDRSIYAHLALLFSAMFRYSLIPDKFMHVNIVPLIKNRGGNINRKDNYRPISLSSVVSKIFEQIIIWRIEHLLYVSENQFAFRKNLSTELCVYVLKQIIQDYVINNTPVFICFLDITKAFDRIDNDEMIKILESRNIPTFITEILKYWFNNQPFFVKWKHITSSGFYPTCGLRQGSKLSPLLFNIYLDKLSNRLNYSKTGCCMGITLINHLCYADATALISPSVKGLQNLIDICQSFGKDYNVIFNGKKTKCMYFKPNNYRFDEPDFILYSESLEIVNSFK